MLERLRKIVKGARAARPARNPGWIVHPNALYAIAQVATRSGHTVDNSQLLKLDGANGGTLLGLPFLTSAAAAGKDNKTRVYFSVDWQEAWLGVEPYLVALYPTGEPTGDDSTVLRASLPLDFALRRKDTFAWTVV